MLTLYFSDAQITPIERGISTFMKLIGLLSDPLHGRFQAEEQDLVAALNSVRESFQLSERMLGKKKYQGIDFNAPEQVQKDLASYLLTGRTEAEDPYWRKRNGPMHYLIIQPTIALFNQFTHEECLENVDMVIDELIDRVNNCHDYGTLEEAQAAAVEVRKIIGEAEAAKKALRDAKRKPRRKSPRDQLFDLFAELLVEVEDELEA